MNIDLAVLRSTAVFLYAEDMGSYGKPEGSKENILPDSQAKFAGRWYSGGVFVPQDHAQYPNHSILANH